VQELYLTEPGQIGIQGVKTLPAVREDEVKIETIYGGICGSDLSVYKGSLEYAIYPVRPGHELLGRVVEAGSRSGFVPGQRVVIQPNTYCGQCEWCSAGKTNICPHKKSLGVNMDGVFSSQFVIPAKYVIPVPDGLSDERAVLTEPLAVVVHAFKKVRIGKGTKVAIIGCGNEGMLAAALALYKGADVVAMDINPNKLDLVKQLGQVRTAHPDEINEEQFEVVIEAAGVSQSVEKGVLLVKPGGSLVLIGLAKEATLQIIKIVRKEISIYGTIIYHVPDDFVQAMEYLKDDQFNISPLVTGIFPLTEYQKAYDTALSGVHGKILLQF